MVIYTGRGKTRTCEHLGHLHLKASKHFIPGLDYLPKALIWIIRISFVLTDRLMQTRTENNEIVLFLQNQYPGSLGSSEGGDGLRKLHLQLNYCHREQHEPGPPLQFQKVNTIREKVQWLEIVSPVISFGFLSTFPRFSNNKAVFGNGNCSYNNIYLMLTALHTLTHLIFTMIHRYFSKY